MEPNRPLEPLNEAAWIRLEVQVEVNKQQVVECPTKEHIFDVYNDFVAYISPQQNFKRTVEQELETGTIVNHYLLVFLHHMINNIKLTQEV